MLETFEKSRRRTLKWLNSRYIYGRVPLLHSILFLLEILIIMRIVAKYQTWYARKPILTTMITNAVLGGIADTVAQMIGAFQKRRATLPANANTQSFISADVELQDLNEKPARFSPSPFTGGPPPFDFERLTRFVSYGFIMTPVQFQWYKALSYWFPITAARGTVPALQRVAMDQLIYAPIGLCCFFTFMTVAEGGGKQMVVKKFQDVYVPTLRANYILWPAVQMLNFRVLPLSLQIPFVSTVGIAWTAYLSLTNSAEDETLLGSN